MITVDIRVLGVDKTMKDLNRRKRGVKRATKRSELRIARSVQQKARYNLESQTITRTGILRSDILIRPHGNHYKVVAGEHAPYARIIEAGRREIRDRKFIPTNIAMGEGYSIYAPGHVIRGTTKGKGFFSSAVKHGEGKAKQITLEELKKEKVID